jgi:hypothetical protein
MIRFILKCTKLSQGLDGKPVREETYETLKLDVPDLEKALRANTVCKTGYSRTTLIGAEVVD